MKLTITILLMISSMIAYSQHTIKFITPDSIPVEKATVRIKNLESEQAPKFFVTDNTGTVVLKLSNGKYLLTASVVGMKLINDTLKITQSDTQFWYVFQPLSIELSSVTVVAKKDVLEVKDDKIVYNVSADEKAKSKSLSQILGNIPFVMVDGNGTAQVDGQSTFKILVNGKETGLFAHNIDLAMKSYPADIINRIELITFPSAKYDAEGVTSIINIITKKFSGYKGFAATYMDNRSKYSNGLTLTAKSGKFGITLNGSLDGIASLLKSYTTSNTIPIMPSAYINRQQSSIDASTRMTGSGILELSYEIDTLNSVISSFELGTNKSHRTSEQDVLTYLPGNIAHGFLITNSNSRSPFTTVGVDYTTKSRKNAASSMTFRFNWAGSHDYSANDGNQQYNVSGSDTKWIVNKSNSKNNEFTFQLDAVPVARKWYTIESGLKAILRSAESDNNSIFTFDLSQPYENDADNTNKFKYRQQVYAGYGSIFLKHNTHSFRAGVRMERTSIKSYFEHGSKPVQEAYISLIPNLNWTNRINKSTTTVFSYNLILQRPFITNLNPFVNKIDSFNISYGNPDLGPQKIHQISFQVRRNTAKVLSSAFLKANLSNDKILLYRLFDPNTGINATTFGNAGNERVFSGGLYGKYSFSNQFNASLTSELRYVDIKNAIQPDQHNSGFGGMLAGSFDWSVNERFNVSGSGGANFPSIGLLGQTSPMIYYQINTGVDVVKDKLFLTANWNNLHANYFSQTTLFQDKLVRNVAKRTFAYRSIYIGIQYTFGKLTQNVARKSGLVNDDIIK